MTRFGLSLTALALLAGATPLRAQQAGGRDRERWQVTLDGERYVWDIRLVRLDGHALVIRQADTLTRLPVAHITEVRLIRASDVDLGAGAAGAMSALTGGDDEVHDLTPLDVAARLREIEKILADHPGER
jgi:hypothetical protein